MYIDGLSGFAVPSWRSMATQPSPLKASGSTQPSAANFAPVSFRSGFTQASTPQSRATMTLARQRFSNQTPHTIAADRYRSLQSQGKSYAEIQMALRQEGLWDAFVHI